MAGFGVAMQEHHRVTFAGDQIMQPHAVDFGEAASGHLLRFRSSRFLTSRHGPISLESMQKIFTKSKTIIAHYPRSEFPQAEVKETAYGHDYDQDGAKIFYKDWGVGQPIVFSHGWPLSGDDWDGQMLYFSQLGYRVIAHDRRGHGRSTKRGAAMTWTPMRTISPRCSKRST